MPALRNTNGNPLQSRKHPSNLGILDTCTRPACTNISKFRAVPEPMQQGRGILGPLEETDAKQSWHKLTQPNSAGTKHFRARSNTQQAPKHVVIHMHRAKTNNNVVEVANRADEESRGNGHVTTGLEPVMTTFQRPQQKTGWGRSTGPMQGKNTFSTPYLPLARVSVSCPLLSCRTLSACLIVSRVTKAPRALQCEDCFTNENCAICVAAICLRHAAYTPTWFHFAGTCTSSRLYPRPCRSLSLHDLQVTKGKI